MEASGIRRQHARAVTAGIRGIPEGDALRFISPQKPSPAEEALVGQRVRIRATTAFGSARLLDGIEAIVTGIHPIARGWYILELAENDITPERIWTAPADRLVPIRGQRARI